jgi:hypothetical protein
LGLPVGGAGGGFDGRSGLAVVSRFVRSVWSWLCWLVSLCRERERESGESESEREPGETEPGRELFCSSRSARIIIRTLLLVTYNPSLSLIPNTSQPLFSSSHLFQPPLPTTSSNHQPPTANDQPSPTSRRARSNASHLPPPPPHLPRPTTRTRHVNRVGTSSCLVRTIMSRRNRDGRAREHLFLLKYISHLGGGMRLIGFVGLMLLVPWDGWRVPDW